MTTSSSRRTYEGSRIRAPQIPSYFWRPHSLTPGAFMIKFMNMKLRLRISKGGQVSIPARIRHRWGTSTVALSDEGHRIVLEPAADDPIAAAEGALAAEFGRLDLRRLRREAREDERVAEARHHKR